MTRILAAAALSLFAGAACAQHSMHQHAHMKDSGFGRVADPKLAKRTVRVEMSDQMRFAPAEVRVKRGEIVRFVPVNKGRLAHEMVLGTLSELKEHAAMMQKMPAMQHHEPNTAHVAPGASGELAWQFTRAGEFYFACLVPGHFEAGMIGKVIVTP